LKQDLTPYDKLKNILTEGEEIILTDKAQNNLNNLLGITEENIEPKKITWIDKVKISFNKIDEKIFSKKSRKRNTTYNKR
jgi:hypothetical protein